MNQVEKIQANTKLDNPGDILYCNVPFDQIKQMPADQIMAWIRNMKILTK